MTTQQTDDYLPKQRRRVLGGVRITLVLDGKEIAGTFARRSAAECTPEHRMNVDSYAAHAAVHPSRTLDGGCAEPFPWQPDLAQDNLREEWAPEVTVDEMVQDVYRTAQVRALRRYLIEGGHPHVRLNTAKLKRDIEAIGRVYAKAYGSVMRDMARSLRRAHERRMGWVDMPQLWEGDNA